MNVKFRILAVVLAVILVLMSVGCRSVDEPPASESEGNNVTNPVSKDDQEIRLGAIMWYWCSSIVGTKEFATMGLADYREPVWGYGYGEQEDMDYQIQLAHQYGLDFFAIDYYGTTMDYAYNYAIDKFVASEYSHLMDFCLIIVQDVAEEIPNYDDWDSVCELWLKYLTMDNYVTVDGCPVLIFSNPLLMMQLMGERNTKEGLLILEEKIKALGYPGIHYVGYIWDTYNYFLEQSYDENSKPRSDLGDTIELYRSIGIDTISQYNNISHSYYENGVAKMEMPYTEMTFRHELVWDAYTQFEDVTYIPLLISGWDNRPREIPQKTPHATDRTAEAFTQHILNSYEWIKENPDTALGNLVIINSWDEVEEGSFIIPTKGEGYKMLEGLKAAADAIKGNNKH